MAAPTPFLRSIHCCCCSRHPRVRARDGAPVREPPTPPSRKTVRQFAQQAPHVSFWRKLYESGEYKRWLLYAVEAYGIFKIGEMVGRRHIVGYKLDESRTHALT